MRRAPRLPHCQRDPEVRHYRLALVQQDVLRLDVAVNHPVTVGVVQGARDLRRDAHRLFDGELLLARELVTQRLAPHVGQHIPHEPLALARVDEGEDVRVVEPGADADLLEEPRGAEHRREFRAQDFQPYFAIVFQVPGEIHRGHPAGAELALDRVAAGEGRSQAGRFTHVTRGKRLQDADRPSATPATRLARPPPQSDSLTFRALPPPRLNLAFGFHNSCSNSWPLIWPPAVRPASARSSAPRVRHCVAIVRLCSTRLAWLRN